MSEKKEKALDLTPSQEEELKREMQAAKLMALALKYKHALIAGGVAAVVILVAGALWMERNKAVNESAATLYYQAIASNAPEIKRTLLDRVVKEYHDTSYGLLATMILAAQDAKRTEALLRDALAHPKLTDALAWQIRLDLASYTMRHGKGEEGCKLLSQPVGKHYEQLRQYLLAQCAKDKESKVKHLELALASESHDDHLRQRIQDQLAKLTKQGE